MCLWISIFRRFDGLRGIQKRLEVLTQRVPHTTRPRPFFIRMFANIYEQKHKMAEGEGLLKSMFLSDQSIIWHYILLWVFAFSARSLQVLLSLAVSFQFLTFSFF
jgi:hypothetical protein